MNRAMNKGVSTMRHRVKHCKIERILSRLIYLIYDHTTKAGLTFNLYVKI